MKTLFLAIVLGTLVSSCATADQQTRHFEKVLSRNVAYDYLVYSPRNVGRKKLPLLLYLHGGSLRGDDVTRLKTMGLPKRLERESDFPFVVVSPQLPAGEIWTDTEALLSIVDDVMREYPVDPLRVYVTGHSMGGRGALYTAFKHPARFTAVLAISPVSPINAWAEGLRGVPVRIIHGSADDIVPIKDSHDLVKQLETTDGCDVTYTVLDNRDHYILDVYDRDDLFDWLLSHSRQAPVSASHAESEGR